jgi:hypothetical protein
MTKQHILDEIKRTAKANGGLPVGLRKFRSITGIKDNDWLGKYWVRWSEAIEEAGLSANSFDIGYHIWPRDLDFPLHSGTEEFLLKVL